MHFVSREDRLFAKFRRSGDSRALGLLFDRTAPDLLKVARYLAGDSALAEDLVQATFIAAIESAGRHEPRRPVVPWLIGILNHLAHDARRKRTRSARAPVIQTPAPADPVRAAEVAEVHAAFANAVRGLPQPYRDVVGLHLDEGLRAIEIAARLGRTADTARKQLARGLTMLRRALPPSLATSVAVVASARGVAAVRSEILSHAREVAVPAAVVTMTAPFVGSATMSKLGLGVSGVTLAVVGVWLARTPATPGTEIETATEVPAALFAPAARQLTDTVDARAVDDAGRVVAADPPRSAGASRFVLRGRCVDARTHEPLAGCSVDFVPAWQLPEVGQTAPAETTARSRRSQQSTTRDGRFEFVLERAGAVRVTGKIQVNHATHAERQGTLPSVLTSEPHDLGDVPLTPGCVVHGRVLDTAGREVPRAHVEFCAKSSSAPGAWMDATACQAPADAAGRFVVRDALAPGAYSVQIQRQHVVSPRALVVEPGVVRLEIDVVVLSDAEVPSIAGTVVDERGMTLAGVDVFVLDSQGSRLSPAWPTDGAGRFAVRRSDRPDAAEPPFRLHVAHPGYEMLCTAQTYGWGTRDVEITLRAGVGVEFEVLDAATRTPIECYGVRWRPRPGDSAFPFESGTWEELRARDPHPRGVATLPMWRGRMFVEVQADDPGYGPSESRVLDVTDAGVPRQRFVLARLQPHTVRIETADHTPVAGAVVEVLQARFDLPVDLQTLARNQAWSHWANAARDLGGGTSNAAGEVSLPLPPGRRLAFRVLGPGCVPQVFTDVDLHPDTPIRLAVTRGATLRGNVDPPERLLDFGAVLPNPKHPEAPSPRHSRLTVQLHRKGAAYGEYFPAILGTRPNPVVDPVRGTFTFEDVPPGTWQLNLHWKYAGESQSQDLGTVADLRAGEVRDAQFGLPAFADLKMRGTVDGVAAEGALWLQPFRLRFVDGVATGRVRIGRYEPVVEARRNEQRANVRLPAIEVRAGSTYESSFAVELGTVVLRALGPDGEPLPGLQVCLRPTTGPGGWWPNLTAADGRTPAGTFGRGSYRAQCFRLPFTQRDARLQYLSEHPGSRDEDLLVDLGAVEISTAHAEITLRVPTAALR